MSNLLSAVFSNDYDKVNQYLDDRLNEKIQQHLEKQEIVQFTMQDLDMPVNEDETLREYLEDGEETFGVSIDWEHLTDETLNDLVREIDALWEEQFR